jgi:arginase
VERILSRREKLLSLLGVPTDVNSSYLRGPAEAPEQIRRTLFSDHSHLCAENGIDLAGALDDLGDLALVDDISRHVEIEAAVAARLAEGRRLICLGGDHSISFPVVAATARHHGPISILHFDAHPDLYDDFEGNPWSHASPFARILETGLVTHLTQVGIRTLNPHLRQQCERFGVTVHAMTDLDVAAVAPPPGPLYVSVDLDALDPAFAPGVSHFEPGGMSVREVLSVIQRLQGPVIGADVVELNPRRDLNGMTAMVAAKLVKELAAVMIATG